jgi:hypothetical protein
MVTPEAIINFIYNHRGRWCFNGWTKEQIGIYLLPFYSSNKLAVVIDGTVPANSPTVIEGVVIYEFPEPKKLYILHIITTKQTTMGRLLTELDTRYPEVTQITGLRKFKREVNFNKSTLNKVYGR